MCPRTALTLPLRTHRGDPNQRHVGDGLRPRPLATSRKIRVLVIADTLSRFSSAIEHGPSSARPRRVEMLERVCRKAGFRQRRGSTKVVSSSRATSIRRPFMVASRSISPGYANPATTPSLSAQTASFRQKRSLVHVLDNAQRSAMNDVMTRFGNKPLITLTNRCAASIPR